MSYDDGHDLTTEDLMVPPPRWMHPLQRFIKSVVEEILPVWEKLRDAMEQIGEQLETINEQEKTRAYQELVTPPVDHPHSHVTHTRTKPPAPARIYRRRTLSSPADAPAGRAPVGGGHGHTRENI